MEEDQSEINEESLQRWEEFEKKVEDSKRTKVILNLTRFERLNLEGDRQEPPQ